MRKIILDTETTGLDPQSGHRIVEIGCVEMINRSRTGKVFHCYINPQRDMPAEAEQVHGLSAAFLADKPVFAEIAEEFMAFLSEDQLVIHNAAFDIKFINAELSRLPLPPISFHRVIDTLDLARKKYPGARVNLDALCRRFNINLEQREKHGALLDARLLSEVYVELLGGAQETLSLAQKQEEAVTSQLRKKRTTTPARSFPPSQEEQEEHRIFLQMIVDPLWNKISFKEKK